MTSCANVEEPFALSVVVYARGRNGSGSVVCSGSWDHVGYFEGDGTGAHAACLDSRLSARLGTTAASVVGNRDRSAVSALTVEGAIVAEQRQGVDIRDLVVAAW
ncbi:hypothetical protein NPX13_g3334 [Xylaria arbuscula]|uniref:Uncharacterized protein n=1 Tax=Xylaria arbuscula TaxID=114810 RepID=A0A9W8NI28_9PEZI|nr:hypothetical protein NPX13_g3334 [Xylaria arbuscula]